MSEKLTLFDRFGGTRKMADMLGEAPSTVQSWKSAGRIPAVHQPKVLDRAQENGIVIDAEDVIFPMGRDDNGDAGASSPDIAAEIIGAPEADSPGRPFATSSPTCSPTIAPSPLPPASPACSMAGDEWPLPSVNEAAE